jgi:hypothetical protein
MDLGGGGFGTIHFSFYFVLSKRVEKGSEAKTKVKGKKHTLVSIFFFFI